MSDNQTNPILNLQAVEKAYAEPGGRLQVLDKASISVCAGEIVLLQGPSGSGKTTLLQIAGCLMRADNGQVAVHGEEVNSASEAQRTDIRRKYIGFVFQNFHLVDALTVRDNVALGLRLKRLAINTQRIDEVLDLLGISHKAKKLPHDLSGGEKQRVAFARAMAGQPILLLADEPTSQLDSHAAEKVAQLVRSTVREMRIAALIATHDTRLHSIADRICRISEGKIDA